MTIAQISSGTPLPPQRPSTGEAPSSGEGDFAQLMALQAPAETGPDEAAPNRAEEARPGKTRQLARTLARSPQAEARRDGTDVQKASRETADAVESKAGDETPDPALAQWLAQWHRPPADTAPVAPTDAKKSLPATDGVEPAETGHTACARPAPEAPSLADDRASHGHPAPRGAEKAVRERPPTVESAAASARDDATAAISTPEREAALTSPRTSFTLPAGFEPAPAAAAPATPAPSGADASVVGVPLPVPLESPEFAAAFGVEISLLAKDGVQQAELHLNPAEMGPVSVQIALDGEKARIDFGAQAAATRAAIEASLPELAAALRDAGLTLAGGGVTQHAGQHGGQRGDERREGEPGRAGAGRAERTGVQAVAPRPAWRGRVSASGVDLYA
jgi:flagellar hook-length control protein FliK